MELKYRNAFNDYYHVLVLIVPYGIEIRVEGYYMIMDSEY